MSEQVSEHVLYMREYRKTSKNKDYMKNYRKNHRSKINVQDSAWRKTQKGKTTIRKSNANYRARNKKIKNAQLLADRNIELLEFCELCPEDDKQRTIERHHPDYDYPLIIISCCKECHSFADNDRIKEGINL